MRKILRNALVYFASAFMALTIAASAQAAKIRIALAETPSDELAAFLLHLIVPRQMALNMNGRPFLTRNWPFRRF